MTDSVLLLLMLLLHMLSSLWANARPLPDWSQNSAGRLAGLR